MTELPCQIPPERLEVLRADPLIIRAVPDGWVAYLDFSESFEPRADDTAAGISRLTETHEPRPSLSMDGWVGFFGYEFLAAHFGMQLRAVRDLELPDGWFGRPSTLIHSSNSSTRVESSDPERESEG